MADEIKEAWSEYRALILAELERQDNEIKANHSDIRKLERDHAGQKAKLGMVVILISAIVSLSFAVVEGLFLAKIVN